MGERRKSALGVRNAKEGQKAQSSTTAKGTCSSPVRRQLFFTYRQSLRILLLVGSLASFSVGWPECSDATEITDIGREVAVPRPHGAAELQR